MSKFVIRKGELDDIPQVHALVKELAAFEREPDAVINTAEDMKEDAFGDDPCFSFFVCHPADDQSKIIGMAIYFVSYSTWKGRSLYLEDIIVNQGYRNQGIGSILLKQVIEEKKRLGLRKLHWQVLDWNEDAISFYKKFGADFDETWVNCSLT